jgi:hypothetical protein
MSTGKQNPTQQRQQPLSLSAMLAGFSGELGLPIRSMPNSRRNRKEEQAFLLSILEQALMISNDVDDCFSEESSSENNDCAEENSRSQNRKQ